MKLLLKSAVIFGMTLPSVALAQETRPELWSGLQRGMTVEEAAVAVLKIDGVKSAKIKTNKKTGMKSVDISHKGRGGDFGGFPGFVELNFDQGGLKSVSINYAPYQGHCLSAAGPIYGRLASLLPQKYTEVSRSRDLDDSYIAQARALRAREYLTVISGDKRATDSVNLVNPTIVFNNEQNAVILKANVVAKNYSLSGRDGEPSLLDNYQNMDFTRCKADYGIVSYPHVQYMIMQDYLNDLENTRDANADEDRADAQKL